jgi:predicted metal-dependent phosphotriesterase family hydrolase
MVLPALERRGVSTAQMQTMLIANPRRCFSGPG